MGADETNGKKKGQAPYHPRKKLKASHSSGTIWSAVSKISAGPPNQIRFKHCERGGRRKGRHPKAPPKASRQGANPKGDGKTSWRSGLAQGDWKSPNPKLGRGRIKDIYLAGATIKIKNERKVTNPLSASRFGFCLVTS